MLIKCVNNANVESLLTVGKVYLTGADDPNSPYFEVINDLGDSDMFMSRRFKIVETKPQEDVVDNDKIVEKLNEIIDLLTYKGELSDGSHTFDELYYHRMILFAVICNQNKDKAWKSMLHHDGTMYDDYFIVGIETPKGQFSYHYHVDHWFKFSVPTLNKAPEWDGHTASDVIRLLSI